MSDITVNVPALNTTVKVGVFGLPGEKGDPGDKGDPGEQGDPGADGNGAVWHVADTNPDDSVGADGDLWLNKLTGDVFRRFSGVYALEGNLQGPAGADGDPDNVLRARQNVILIQNFR